MYIDLRRAALDADPEIRWAAKILMVFESIADRGFHMHRQSLGSGITFGSEFEPIEQSNQEAPPIDIYTGDGVLIKLGETYYFEDDKEILSGTPYPVVGNDGIFRAKASHGGDKPQVTIMYYRVHKNQHSMDRYSIECSKLFAKRGSIYLKRAEELRKQASELEEKANQLVSQAGAAV